MSYATVMRRRRAGPYIPCSSGTPSAAATARPCATASDQKVMGRCPSCLATSEPARDWSEVMRGWIVTPLPSSEEDGPTPSSASMAAGVVPFFWDRVICWPSLLAAYTDQQVEDGEQPGGGFGGEEPWMG